MKDYIKHLYNIKDNESALILIPNNKTILRKESIKPSIESKKIYKRKSKLLGLNISLKGRLKGARRARRLVHNWGSTGPNSFNKRSKSNNTNIYTKWGIWNLKTSISRSINQRHHL